MSVLLAPCVRIYSVQVPGTLSGQLGLLVPRIVVRCALSQERVVRLVQADRRFCSRRGARATTTSEVAEGWPNGEGMADFARTECVHVPIAIPSPDR